jgi:hypothetical protein
LALHSCLLVGSAFADNSSLALADLPAYHAALKDDLSTAVASVRFRDLWERPAEFEGRRVVVEGTIERRFRQPAVGQFPALCELWLVAPDKNPLGIVFPDTKRAPGPGDRVRFRGTFLRLIRYPSGDVERLAPLVVGGRAPEVLGGDALIAAKGLSWSAFEWSIGGALACLVVMVLALQYARRPRGRVRVGPPPSFLDREEAADEGP